MVPSTSGVKRHLLGKLEIKTEKLKPGFYLACDQKPYLARRYETEREAQSEAEELLRAYPIGHEWRARFAILWLPNGGK